VLLKKIRKRKMPLITALRAATQFLQRNSLEETLSYSWGCLTAG
jgi:hypothetical protein